MGILERFNWRRILVQLPPALAALILSADIWLKLARKTSLCTTHSCQIVGEYVRFGETFLIVLGGSFFCILWLFLFFACRYDKKWLWTIVLTLLFGSLAFDGGLLGFQFLALKERCALCIGVGLALFFSLISLAWFRRSVTIVVLGLAVWSGGFTANSMLKFIPKIPKLSEVTVLSWHDKEVRNWPEFHLFFSLHCGHCSKVMANLAINNPGEFKWFLIPLDHRPEDMQKLAHLFNLAKKSKNIFRDILKFESEEEVEPVKVPEELEVKINSARQYFKSLGYKGVPLLIVREKPGVMLTLVGEKRILDYLKQRGVVRKYLVFPEDIPEVKKMEK